MNVLEEARQLTRQALLSDNNIFELYDEFKNDIFNNAKASKLDLLVYPDNYKSEVFWNTIKLLELDGFIVTRYEEAPYVINISWRSDGR